MKQSKLLQKTITKLIEASFNEGKILEFQVVKSIKLLKSLPKYQAIWTLQEYLKQLKRKERQHTMYIETVIPLTDWQIKKAKKIVEKRAMPDGRQVKITKVKLLVNPQILGGFKLKVGDNIWDESILGKLNQLKEEITHGRFN